MTDAERQALIPGERVMAEFAGKPVACLVKSPPFKTGGVWFVDLNGFTGGYPLERITGYADPTEIVFVVDADGDHVCPFKDQRAVIERLDLEWACPANDRGYAWETVVNLTRAGYDVVFKAGKAAEPPATGGEVV